LQTPIVGIDGGSDRLSDHGPSRSKVAHTIVGAQMSQAALSAIAAAQAAAATRPSSPSPVPANYDMRRAPEHAEPITIPTTVAPAWMVGGVVLTALALAMVAGYYLLR
jgi:hypothetical protein